jgi:hypothetical protein
LLLISICPTNLARADNVAKSEKPAVRALPDHYLLLVNTAIAFMMDESKLRQFDKSPYDGLAIAFLHAYDTSEVPSVASMDSRIKEWKTFTKKDIWPWVYINRMIGFNQAEKNAHSDTPYFRKIRGADLDDTSGARSDFLRLWRNSLAAARNSQSPGIVCDLEFYNYYNAYNIGQLGRLTGKKPAETAESLKQIGAQMARIAAEEYPGAAIWFLLTGLTHAGHTTYDGIAYYPSPTYIAIGLLDEIARQHLQLKIFTGGEGSLFYCHATLDELRSAILKRGSDLDSDLQKYQGILEMAGTITLWSDRAAKQGWVSEGKCQTATANNVEELQPYLELLLRTYRYNWIYASGDGNYLAFSPESAPRFDAVIKRAETQVSADAPH